MYFNAKRPDLAEEDATQEIFCQSVVERLKIQW